MPLDTEIREPVICYGCGSELDQELVEEGKDCCDECDDLMCMECGAINLEEELEQFEDESEWVCKDCIKKKREEASADQQGSDQVPG